MDEDRINENRTEDTENKETQITEIKTGLEPADTADYQVNAGDISAAAAADADARKRAAEKKKRRGTGKRSFSFAAGFICCIAVILTATYVLGLGRFVPQKRYEYLSGLDRNYGKYAQIMRLIGEDPIAEYDAVEIDDARLKELVAGIGDPYAEYFTAEEYKEFRRRYAGDYVGIGIGVAEEDGNIVVKRVFSDSPAEDAGMMADDIIKAVDGKEPADVDEAIELISGEAGTEVAITVLRGDETLDLTTYRARIDQESVAYFEYEDETRGSDTDIGYIYISSFIKGTADDFKQAVKELKNEGCDRFIIDLRDNGGGLTDESIEIADYLLPACKIMSEVSKSGKETVYNSKASSAGIEYAVLVNGNTASASEILSAAIQDNHGGLIIGTKTYGKGVTQITHMFDDGSAIKITTTEYFRPGGGTVNGVGITPDIEAEGSEALEKALEELEK